MKQNLKNLKKMETTFATKLSKVKFSYHLIGFGQNVEYDTMSGNLVLVDSETNSPIANLAAEESLDFETFILVAQNLLIDIIQMSN